jgi:lipid-A-disaccharide synthase-like uncharacterized protein
VIAYLQGLSQLDRLWILVGFLGQFLFMMRFLWQWVQSERRRRSYIPIAFWYFSVGGGAVLLAYAIHRLDPVFITGQAMGLVIYIRNLALIRGERRRTVMAGAGKPPRN